MADEKVNVEAQYTLNDKVAVAAFARLESEADKLQKHFLASQTTLEKFSKNIYGAVEAEAARMQRRFGTLQNSFDQLGTNAVKPMERTTSSLKSMVDQAIRLAATYASITAVGNFTKSIVTANSALETAQMSMAGLLFNSRQMGYSVGPISNMNEALKASAGYYRDLEQYAAKAIGTTQDYTQAFAALQLPVLQAGGSMEQLVEMTKLMVPTAQMLGQPMETASFSVKQALMGMVDARDMLINQLGFSSAKMNEMAKEGKALDAIMGALRRNRALSESFGGTFEAKFATLQDSWLRLKRDLGRPLFEALGSGLDRLNAWAERNQTKIRDWARDVGTGIKDSFETAVNAVSWMRDHWDGIRSTVETLVKVWIGGKLIGHMRELAGLARTFGASMGAASAAGSAGGLAAGGMRLQVASLVAGTLVVEGAMKVAEAIRMGNEAREYNRVLASTDIANRVALGQRAMGQMIPGEAEDVRAKLAQREGWGSESMKRSFDKATAEAAMFGDALAEYLKLIRRGAGLSSERELTGFQAPPTSAIVTNEMFGKKLKDVKPVNDFRGSKIEIKVDARHLDHDRVAITIQDALGRAAARPTGARTALRGGF